MIIIEPGQFFGKTGEIVQRAPRDARDLADWIVALSCNQVGIGFLEWQLMRDPRRW